MPRPHCCRRVAAGPVTERFGPLSGSTPDGEDIVLQVDELEAVRLADMEHLYHQAAADEMNVSRQTFGRILDAAHAKIADALVNSRPLRIEGGHVEMCRDRTFVCAGCGHSWLAPAGTGRPDKCDACGSADFHCADRGRHHSGGCCGGQHGHGHGHGRNRGCGQDAAPASTVTSPDS